MVGSVRHSPGVWFFYQPEYRDEGALHGRSVSVVLLRGAVVLGVRVSCGRHPVPLHLLSDFLCAPGAHRDACDLDCAHQHRDQCAGGLHDLSDREKGGRRAHRACFLRDSLSAVADGLLPDRAALRHDGDLRALGRSGNFLRSLCVSERGAGVGA